MLIIPFTGSKRTSVKKMREIVKAGGYTKTLEPFGGSGIITVNLYNDGLIEDGVINDYDYFFSDFERALDYKDLIIKDCEAAGMVSQKNKVINGKNQEYIIKNGETIYRKRTVLPDKYKKVLQDSVKRHVPEKDYKIMANFKNFTYPMKGMSSKVSLKDFAYYRRGLSTDAHREYLKVVNNLTVDHLDWRDFLKKYATGGVVRSWSSTHHILIKSSECIKAA